MIRTELREHIFKLLFQEEFNQEEDMQEHLKYYFMTLENAADKDKDYIQEKYEAVAGHIAEIDELINQYAKGWKTTRMNKVDLAILRLAVYEMKWDEEVPVGVGEEIQRWRQSVLYQRGTWKDRTLCRRG